MSHRCTQCEKADYQMNNAELAKWLETGTDLCPLKGDRCKTCILRESVEVTPLFEVTS